MNKVKPSGASGLTVLGGRKKGKRGERRGRGARDEESPGGSILPHMSASRKKGESRKTLKGKETWEGRKEDQGAAMIMKGQKEEVKRPRRKAMLRRGRHQNERFEEHDS